MKKILTLILINLIIIINIIPISGQNLNKLSQRKNECINNFPNANPNNDFDIIIPDDYPTIQQGIDEANPGYRIFVRSGIYKESIKINKEKILLQGEDKYNTVIYGHKTKEDGIFINAESVTIQEFTITNFNNDEKLFMQQAGVKIYSSDATIKDNIITYNEIGLEVYCRAYNITILDNEFINNGITLGNYLNSKGYSALTEKDFIHNINNNTINGRPIFYQINKNDFIVPYEVGQILMFNCSNVTIKDIYLSHTDFPITLAYCNNCLLENLTIIYASGENLFFRCNNNTIQNNKISNIFKGVCLEIESRDNIIRYNEFSNNSVGISLFNSANNNSIYQNIVINNEFYGIEIVSYRGGIQLDNIVKENEIYNNNLGVVLRGHSINNIVQNNTIKNSLIGLILENLSDENIIEHNDFMLNIIPAAFNGCYNNYFNHNYWNRPRLLPKLIKGFRPVGNFKIPFVDIDKRPAMAPNNS